jgi:hypothetical protein
MHEFFLQGILYQNDLTYHCPQTIVLVPSMELVTIPEMRRVGGTPTKPTSHEKNNLFLAICLDNRLAIQPSPLLWIQIVVRQGIVARAQIGIERQILSKVRLVFSTHLVSRSLRDSV